MQDLPTAAELLDAVREFIEHDVHPHASRATKFHARVAMNVLAIVKRELELGPAADAAERARLHDLLPGTPADASLWDMNAALAARIRDRSLGAERDAVVAHLRATLRDKLEIANPRHLPD